MVLHPIAPKPCPTVHYEPRPAALPAWTAIAQRQKQCAESWWLIAQPDHASLSRDLAANFVSPAFPHIDAAIAKAIANHDAGWSMFTAESNPNDPPMISEDFKPRSFIEFPPQDFLRAWTASIERAESICPAGGVMVSRHFCALAQMRVKQQMDSGLEAQLVQDFLASEHGRQEQLSAKAGVSNQHADELLTTLQFCDMLSLYLCCGAEEEVEFPQIFRGQTVHLKRTEDVYTLSPSPFQNGSATRTISLGVSARKYPSSSTPEMRTLPFLLK